MFNIERNQYTSRTIWIVLPLLLFLSFFLSIPHYLLTVLTSLFARLLVLFLFLLYCCCLFCPLFQKHCMQIGYTIVILEILKRVEKITIWLKAVFMTLFTRISSDFYPWHFPPRSKSILYERCFPHFSPSYLFFLSLYQISIAIANWSIISKL